MKMKSMLKDIREYENLHIALWLVKDTCWVMTWKLGGMLMIVPTLAVALHLAWKSRKKMSDLFHNIGVCFWIAANATWMTGEFFYRDFLRPYAMILFTCGLAVVAVYYLMLLPKRHMQDMREMQEAK